MLVTVNSLNETFQKTKKDLFMLPSVFMGDEMARSGIAMIPGIQDEMKSYSYLRNTINLMPYLAGRTYTSAAVGEIKKRILKVYLVNMSAQDNIQDYVHTDVAGFSLLGTNKSYKNPAERLISYSIMKGITEAILNRMWFMVRNEAGKTSSDLTDGWLELLSKAETAGEISKEERNLINVGPIIAPTSDTDTQAYKQALEFLMSVNPALLRGNPVVSLTTECAVAIQAAMNISKRNFKEPDKYGSFNLPEFPGVKFVPNYSMGYGDMMQLSQPGNMMYGFDSMSDEEYIEASKLNQDRNIVDYWAQFRIGMQYQSLHEKVFARTTGTLNPESYEGDVKPAGVYTVSATAGANGTVTVTPTKEKYAFGEKIKLEATPSAGTHVFDRWSDGSLDAVRNIAVRNNMTVQATFKAKA